VVLFYQFNTEWNFKTNFFGSNFFFVNTQVFTEKFPIQTLIHRCNFTQNEVQTDLTVLWTKLSLRLRHPKISLPQLYINWLLPHLKCTYMPVNCSWREPKTWSIESSRKFTLIVCNKKKQILWDQIITRKDWFQR
jgi:hypothetical protein